MIDPQLENKVVLISGASHDISAPTAKAFTAQGSMVFITYYRSKSPYPEEDLQGTKEAGTISDSYHRFLQQQSADEIMDRIRSLFRVAAGYKTDLGNSSNVPALFGLCEPQFGPIDILVNNDTHCPLETLDPELIIDDGGDVH
jgi:NAD(P)-dependent dehydrogenase (short-subunit alcohol dehydrogenase family)